MGGGGRELKEERERKKDFVHSYGHWPVLCFILFIGMMFHDVCSLNLSLTMTWLQSRKNSVFDSAGVLCTMLKQGGCDVHGRGNFNHDTTGIEEEFNI